MPESVEAGAGRPEGQRVVLSSRTRKRGKQGGEDAGARETPRQSRNCLCSGTGSSAEAATGAGHVRRWRRSWRGSRAGTRAGPGGGGTGRRLSQPRMEPAYSGPLSEWRPEPGAREGRELRRDWGWSQRARSSAWCRTGGTGDRCGGGVVAWGVRERVPPQARVAIAGPRRRLRGRLNPREWRHRSCSRRPCFRLCTQIPERPEPPSQSASQGCPITRGGGCIPQGDSGRGGLPRWLRGGRRLESWCTRPTHLPLPRKERLGPSLGTPRGCVSCAGGRGAGEGALGRPSALP